MGQKFKNWHNPDRKPKRFKNLNDSNFDYGQGKPTNDRKDRSNKNNKWRQSWDKEL